MSAPVLLRFIHQELLETQARKQPGSKDLEACLAEYKTYQYGLAKALADSDFEQLALVVDGYLNFAKQVEQLTPTLGARSKYYSSILEELPVYLAKDLVEGLHRATPKLGSKQLLLGDANCAIRVGVSPSGSQFCETKRIDFCLALYSPELSAYVPLVGYEVKKYMDKTMFGTVLETYKALQIFRPRTVYGFVVEDEARDADVRLNSPMYRDEFVLTGMPRSKKEDRNPIQAKSLEEFYKHLKASIESAFAALTLG